MSEKDTQPTDGTEGPRTKRPLPDESLDTLIQNFKKTAAYQSATTDDRKLLDELVARAGDAERSVQALHESESLYSSLVENLPIHVARKDLNGQITYANQSFCELLGLNPLQVIGQTDHDLFPAEVADKYRGDDLWVIETGKVFEDVEENPASGIMRYYEVRKTPVRSDSDHIVGVQIIFWDVTQRIQTQQALREAKETAESANRAKGNFVANVSHEIRTPLNAVIGMTEILLNTDVDESQRDYLSMVRDSGETLLALINDVLDFSKIEAGRLELDPVPFDLVESLGTTMKTLAVRAQSKSVEFVFRVATDVPSMVIGDALRLRQVIVNLVGNAIKFTEKGEITLTVDLGGEEKNNQRQVDEPEDSNHAKQQNDEDVVLRFRVADTGIGIPPDVSGQIFDAFEQADSSTTRRYGGTGLGLAITSQLVKAMRGEIHVESTVDVGSCFEFSAEFGLPTEQPQPFSHDLAGQRVLVVDDNQTNREMIYELISQSGATVVCAESGEVGLAKFNDAKNATQEFHLVVTDIAMPDMSGYELVKQVREENRPEPKVIVMTSGIGRDDMAWCRKMEVSAHLLKPIKRSELFDAVERTLVGNATQPIHLGNVQSNEQELRSLKILVVEDSPVNQKLAIGLLERENHRVSLANNGHEAVLAYKSQTFDLVLMDIQMPKVDGLEATKLIREMEQDSGKRVPIIAMTAHALPRDRARCMEAGMDGYVTKPIRVNELYRELEPFLQ